MPGAEQRMAGGSSVRWLLWLGLGLVLLAVLGVLIYGRLVGQAAPPPTADVAGSGVTARQAFALASELAMQWQEDAGLAAVSGHWPAVGTHLGDQVEWAYQFFSPSTQRLALITVAGGEARVVRESVSPYVIPTFPVEKWRVDSDQALQMWWNHGGKSLVARRPDASLAMQLRMPDGGGPDPVWTVAGFVGGTETAITAVVNATDGRLVE
jgi:hypothetical protein